MDQSQADYACSWVRQMYPAQAVHKIVHRAVLQHPGMIDSITLLEVAQRSTPQDFAGLLEPPSIRELFLEELLTFEQPDDTILLS